jgi:lipoprotein-releasing system permease protein
VYKLLLCWRYLKTRYLALVCVVSVMLGVATLIVVNSVMAGFSTKLRDRLHGVLADVAIESFAFHGFENPDGMMDRIRHSAAGPYVAAMCPAIETPAILQFTFRGTAMTKMVKVIGVDAAQRAEVGGFGGYLFDMEGKRIAPSYDLSPAAKFRFDSFRLPSAPAPMAPVPPEAGDPLPVEEWVHEEKQVAGMLIGKGMVHFRNPKPNNQFEDVYTCEPGDTVSMVCLGGAKLTPEFDRFAVAGYFNSEMSEYDSNLVFVPFEHLQRLRGMQYRATCIQLRLTDYSKAKLVVDVLREEFSRFEFVVQTWEEKQGPILAAIDIERGILNVLLFLIVGVAGFGILAIFSMIVVEKTRDIGVLKALGASNAGIMGIFLGYGLLLGIVGDLLGTGIGLAITKNLNAIEAFLSKITGQQVFSRQVYNFNDIPVDVQPMSVLWINVGAIAVAAVFSLLPALKAARLQPVRALRFE